MTAGPLGWDHADTARYYARFQRRYARYRRANRALVRRAALADGMHVLDVAAGDGGTAAAALPWLGRTGRVVCVEPAGAMRALGSATLRDARVTWADRWPDAFRCFDRVLCGAAIWQMQPLGDTLERCHAQLKPGGCLVFDIPSLYLLEPDEPGGGRDPLLLELGALLPISTARNMARSTVVLDAEQIEVRLRAAGFQATRWHYRARFGQRAYREWLKIPPTTDAYLAGLDADARAQRIDAAFAHVDAGSWRWERWTGWTAWTTRP